MRRLREHFRPEFLNRIDEVIVFRAARAEQLRQITDLLLEETRGGCTPRASTSSSPPAALDWLAELGLPARVRGPAAAPDHPAAGRQPALRMLLSGSAGPTVTVDVADDRLDFQVEHGAPEEVKEESRGDGAASA